MVSDDHAGLRAEFEFRPPGQLLPGVKRGALGIAERQLKRGRFDVLKRQGRQRRWGAGALAVPPLTYLVLPESQTSRRRFLSAAALLLGGSSLGLAATYRDEELAGFDAAEARLAALRKLTR